MANKRTASNDTIQSLLILFAAVIGIILFVYVGGEGIKRTERQECLKWKEDALWYDGYYLAKWQETQCKHYGITIETTIQLTN
jgi:hypothetical protein